ncbi:hypothetical protein ACF1DY_06305 [Streptomyces albus]
MLDDQLSASRQAVGRAKAGSAGDQPYFLQFGLELAQREADGLEDFSPSAIREEAEVMIFNSMAEIAIETAQAMVPSPPDEGTAPPPDA